MRWPGGLVAILTLCAGCGGPADPADLLLRGGRIVTLDPRRPVVSALVARGGVILATGEESELRRFVGPETRVFELDGATAYPGFIEAHGHFTGLGRSRRVVDLNGAADWPEVIQRVRDAAADREPGSWIVGWGWHQEKWVPPPAGAIEGYPTHDLLSAAVPDHPVLLKHAAGSHACLVNARAMLEAGIDETTPDPQGGRLLRDPNGRPTGVLQENATGAALAALAHWEESRPTEANEAEARAEIRLAAEECLRHGVTSFQDAGSDFATVDRLRRLAEAGELPVRLWVMLSENNEALEHRIADYRLIGVGGQRLTVRAIKRLADGALGSHGAWLLEPYSDLPGHRGQNTESIEALEQTARLAVDHDFQLCVHAIGDRANRETLDLFERAVASPAALRERRWRVEHVQHLHPADLPRFAQLGVIASMQPIHCTSDGPWVPRRLGPERAGEGAYLWRQLLDTGAVIASGTDTPVERIDPIANFHAAVTRVMANEATFYPEQRMTREEALHAATLGAAYAAFEDDIKGSLEPGKLADVVILSEDLLRVADDRIRETRVLATIVGGEVAWRAASTAEGETP